MNEYLTTKELAELLRIKERKVYDLAASGDIPCSRAMGKLLFPRAAVEAWLAGNATGGVVPAPAHRPNVFLGSHDPLLDWALRESQCGLATYFDASLDGLQRFDAGEGVASGLHVFDPHTATWNTQAISQRFANQPVVLVEWAWRERGLIISQACAAQVQGLSDLAGCKMVPRQPEAGSQRLFEHLAAEAGLETGSLRLTAPARSEADAALAVHEGKADAAFGLQALAAQYRLPFISVIRERFDILVDRRAWFEPPMQTLLTFCRSQAFQQKAEDLAGYDVRGFGTVHFNGQ